MEGKPIMAALKIYAHERTLHKEFSSYDELMRVVELMVEKGPDLIVETHVELSDSCDINTSEIGMDEFADCSEGRDSESLDPGKP